MPNYNYQKKRNRRRNSRPVSAPKIPLNVTAVTAQTEGTNLVRFVVEFDQPLSGWEVGDLRTECAGVLSTLYVPGPGGSVTTDDGIFTEVLCQSSSILEFVFTFDSVGSGFATIGFSEDSKLSLFSPSAAGVGGFACDSWNQPTVAQVGMLFAPNGF